VLWQHTLDLLAGSPRQLGPAINQTMSSHYAALSLPPFVERVLQSSQGPGALACFSPYKHILPQVYVSGIQHRCLQPLRDKLPAHCSCGFDVSNKVHLAIVQAHLLSCTHNFGYTFTNRHHRIVQAIFDVLAAYHVGAVKEPTFLSATLRPDLFVRTHKPILVDVTVVDPANHYTVKDLAERRAVEKHAKYDGLAESHNALFFPFVMESFGATHRECELFSAKVAQELPEAFFVDR
jgi:hypothetical protein